MYFCISLLIIIWCLSLQVDAYPAAVTFSWFFNNSEHQEALEDERFTTSGLVSTLNFAPTTNQDYGTLFCLGENAVGHQEEPCAFKIVPTGKKSFWGDPLLLYFPKAKRKSSFLCCKDTSWSRSQGMAKYRWKVTAFQLYSARLNTDEYICHASNTNKLGKIGCKTRGHESHKWHSLHFVVVVSCKILGTTPSYVFLWF